MKTQWSYSTIEKACQLVTDGTHYTPPNLGDGYPFLTVKDMTNAGLNFDDCSRISRSEFQKAFDGNSVPLLGDVLFSKDGTVGKVHVVNESDRYAVLSSIAILRPNPSILDSSYFGYVLKTPQTIRQASRKKTGSALRRIILRDLKGVKIPLPPLDIQRKIAAVLDKADALRRKRQQALKRTEDLLRSVFLDMFGDPVTNPMGWPSGNIELVVENKSDIRCGPFGTQLKVHELVSEGVPLLGIENVGDDKFVPAVSKYLTTAKARQLNRFDAIPGDVLVTRMGTIGRACVVPEDYGECRISYHLFRIRPNKDKCLPQFLAATISRSGTFQTQLERLAHGAIMSG